MTPSPVYLVGGSKLFRQGLRVYLEGTPFEAVREIEHASDAKCRSVGEVPAALILFALSHGQDDYEASIKTLGLTFTDTPVVVIAESLALEDVTRCLASGVGGYLLSDISTDALSYSLQLVMLGEKVFPTQMASFWTQTPTRPSASASKAIADGGGPAQYTAGGKKIVCRHCGHDRFDEGRAQLNTASLSFLNLDWANRSATTLTCDGCGRIQWYGVAPERF